MDFGQAFDSVRHRVEPALDMALCVGEASGDWIAALAIEELLARHEGQVPLQIEGIVGPKLRELNIRGLHQAEELSVRGYVEVLRHLPRLLRMRKQLKRHWSGEAKPKVFMGVDAPDFNFGLEIHLRQAGVPVVHLVCPSIWAWRKERIETIRKACDQVLCVFPFEPEILHQAGIQAQYIGHPMASIVPVEQNMGASRQRLSLNVNDEILAVLPGSRGAEIQYIGPAFVGACLALKKHKPNLKFLTPLPAGGYKAQFEAQIPAHLKTDWTLIEGRSHECLAASNAVLLASGTATLEAMMWRKPMVIAYKMPWLSYQLMKGKGYLPWIGLPNILLKDFAVPELIQDEATPEALSKAVLFQLDDDKNRSVLEQRFAQQHEILRQPSGRLVADVLETWLSSSHGH